MEETGCKIISGAPTTLAVTELMIMMMMMIMKETFTKKYIVERTNKAEIRPEDQSEKAESCREKLWTEIQLKGP